MVSEYYTGVVPAGEAEGVECPFCMAAFAVFMLDPDHPEAGRGKFISCSGEVDYFCPCCGRNLKDYCRDRNSKPDIKSSNVGRSTAS